MRQIALFCFVSLWVVACDDNTSLDADSGSADSGSADSGSADSGRRSDLGQFGDANPKLDGTIVDTAVVDSAIGDAALEVPDEGFDASVQPEIDQGVQTDAAPPEPDPSDEAFDIDHLIEVQITLPPADFDVLRVQGRSFTTVLQPDCLSQPFESPFSWFRAEVTIDGEVFPDVGIRKKGFLGSLSTTRPSIKVHFEKFDQMARFRGLKRMTFNNNRQDDSQMHQCVAYRIFAEAGIPTPRCSLARLTVNGQDLGVYSHIESMKKSFLRRHFDDDEGDLYEGQFSDFREGWSDTFQQKTNRDEPPKTTVIADISTALLEPDETFLGELAQHLDIDSFYRFWTTEILTSHWDGYSGNMNNYFFYADPTTGRAFFMPWGTDGTFEDRFGGGPGGPVALRASGLLHRRLYTSPGGGERYVAALRAALERYDEDDLYAYMDRMNGIAEPALNAEQRGNYAQTVGELRQFIGAMRGRIEGEIANGPPNQDGPLRAPFCREQTGTLDLAFDTTWGSYPNGPAGAGHITGVINDAPFDVDATLTVGLEQGGQYAGQAIFIATFPQDNTTLTAQIIVQPELLSSDEPLTVDDIEVKVYLQRPGRVGRPTVLGIGYEGTLTFEAISTAAGERVIGRVTAELMSNGR